MRVVRCRPNHARSCAAGEDIEHPSHKQKLLEHRPRAAAGALPAELALLDETSREDFKLLAAGSRSIGRETVRLVLLVELFGASVTATALREVMQTGHVGAECIEYVLRHRRGLVPQPDPLRVGIPELDAIPVPPRTRALRAPLPNCTGASGGERAAELRERGR